jgi:hypothetical protein
MKQDLTFTLTIESQEMIVHYWPNTFESPHEPRHRIPVSETGYRSHFAPSWEVAAAPSVEEYARAVALSLKGLYNYSLSFAPLNG